MSKYFTEPKSSEKRVKKDLSNYATEANLKFQQVLIHQNLLKRLIFSKLKKKLDILDKRNKLDIDKSKIVQSNLNNLKVKQIYQMLINQPVPVDLSTLSNVVKSDLITKGIYNAKIKNIEGKILDITNLATTTTTNAKINEVKGKIPSITNLATTNALNAKLNEV